LNGKPIDLFPWPPVISFPFPWPLHEYHDLAGCDGHGWPRAAEILGGFGIFSQKAEKTESRDERLFKIAGCLSRAVAV